MGRKHCGKRRNCSLRAISPFPTVFSKDLYCRNVKKKKKKNTDKVLFGIESSDKAGNCDRATKIDRSRSGIHDILKYIFDVILLRAIPGK